MTNMESRMKEIAAWPDQRLESELFLAARAERASSIALLLRLGEFLLRELSERKGYASAFDFCVRKLGYSRAGAYRSIAVAKAGKKFPSVLDMIESGDLHLTGAALVAAHLTSDNHKALLLRVKGKSEREIEALAGGLASAPARRDRIRIVAAPAALAESAPAPVPSQDGALELIVEAPASRSAEELHEVSFLAGKATVELINRAVALLRHSNPDGKLEPIVKRALEELLQRLDPSNEPAIARQPRKRCAESDNAGRPSRYVPAAIRREVWRRDRGRCVFVGSDGIRCGTTAWLEIEHKQPHALGGPSDDPGNLALFCRTHNQFAARQIFGESKVGPHRRPSVPPAH